MPNLYKLMIDGHEVSAEGELTLIQVCEQAGVEIPRFCYHERLSIAGNCRMCLVEVVGAPKPVASCAMQVRDLRPGRDGSPPQVRTSGQLVEKARHGVMEFLLINHPLDCPICDQGGECDLQDQAMAYGIDFSRYIEPKRAVDDLDLGPLVETHMTRCISCTRCVRFTTEVAGITQMGQIGRGEDAEITSYLNSTLDSNLQGNIIDLCPVGALTSKPYAFVARPWELAKTETIDVMDALGSNIRVDTRGRDVMRILPRNHDGINQEWISDKTRFVWDGLACQRLDRPYVRRSRGLEAVDWDTALTAAASAISAGRKLSAIAGDLAPVEAAFALRQLIEANGGVCECRVDGAALARDNRSAYAGTARIEDVDAAKRIVLIGTNPRVEAPVLNARIRLAWLNGAEVGQFGDAEKLTYDCHALGSDIEGLRSYCESLTDESTSGMLVIVGQPALRQNGGDRILALALELARRGAGLLFLHSAAGRVGALDVGFSCDGGIEAALSGANVVFNLGADEIDIPDGPQVIYQGSHGDRGAHRADIILPSAAYTEESAIFVNTEGRPQLARRAAFPPGQARENWAIVRALSGVMNKPLKFDTLAQLRSTVFASVPHLERIDEVPVNELRPLPVRSGRNSPISSGSDSFYLSNAISRSSAVMAEMASLGNAKRQPERMAA
ncbi:MAG: NADH-quinone oxidoreductase subunit NuoG [Rhodobacteraceae bacterium]|nr:NADH-quinone oxidoreductase subunit NuoG [Paracoccaceae bacterium]